MSTLAEIEAAITVLPAEQVDMRQCGEREALTTDHHFEQEGFMRLLPR